MPWSSPRSSGWRATDWIIEPKMLPMPMPPPPEGAEAEADTSEEIEQQNQEVARHGFGAQFVEVRVDVDSGEVRVPRLLGVFAVGRIINPKTARSQFIGGMTMGMGMALLEESVMD